MSCPGDCCRAVHLNGKPEELIEQLITTTTPQTKYGTPGTEEESRSDLERMVSLFWPSPYSWGYYECEAFDRATRRCTQYDQRPAVCSRYPNYDRNDACDHCTYDARHPDMPGVRYAAIEESGVFCHDNQPEMKMRLERMGLAAETV